ncbi:serine/threonine-protein phosphatase [Streptomyces bathyalis]|uniref:Serine/threonine-protein phosphatase n=1 Tax=Streptomyces bathyalis TaxID=2710756 RepID=A0A7T1T2U6_9ACTN|nr:PP2C family protein-serine/threonine phosphatase [Streptomyces bathyalis]QPP05347.1 serine/threonine-protein phosphatase [Streptomyces bathyalis]
MVQPLVALRRSVRARHWILALPILLIVTVVVTDVLAPSHIHFGPLLVAAPAITASVAGPRLTALVAALAVGAQAVIAVLRDPDELFSANHQAQIVALVLVGATLVIFCGLRERRRKELQHVRHVAGTAQRLVLRPLPEKIGPLRVASLYLAAEAEAQMGGDLYAAARTDSSTRLIIGDVRGKGVPAIGDAAVLLGAFRAATRQFSAMADLAAFLDDSASWQLAEPGEPEEPEEHFITATILEIPDSGGIVRLIECGHPPPIVVRDGNITMIESDQPAPPLGLGDLASQRYNVDEFTFDVGDLLLLYTDGVIETRDSTGAFYPLAERITGWKECEPGPFLEHLKRDLLAHAGEGLSDDVAALVIERLPASR